MYRSLEEAINIFFKKIFLSNQDILDTKVKILQFVYTIVEIKHLKLLYDCIAIYPHKVASIFASNVHLEM